MLEKDRISYERTKMQKELVVHRLRELGCRITRQRMILLDIILQEECSCPKEIYYKAGKKDNTIGKSTVYRMVALLEDIGAISRKNMYKIACDVDCKIEEACVIELDDDTMHHLSPKQWNEVIQTGLKACGLCDLQKVRSVNVIECKFET